MLAFEIGVLFSDKTMPFISDCAEILSEDSIIKIKRKFLIYDFSGKTSHSNIISFRASRRFWLLTKTVPDGIFAKFLR